MIKSIIAFMLLLIVHLAARLHYRLRVEWITPEPRNYAKGTRIICILNHTSLYEPLLAGYAPAHLLWKFARHGVLPVAEKTMRRPIGAFFAMLVRHTVVVTRQRDQTWDNVLNKVDDKAIVVILPEGRMKRANGLDSKGREMTVRGGIADILEVLDDGRMLMVYSGGLHHIQVPGEKIPHFFKTIRCRMEMIDIADYKRQLAESPSDGDLRKSVVADLTRRRDEYCTFE
ncbi:MAG: 1-acyl-sn-glycerol-3-phosphate acyltransferase [Holophagae bacterium]